MFDRLCFWQDSLYLPRARHFPTNPKVGQRQRYADAFASEYILLVFPP